MSDDNDWIRRRADGTEIIGLIRTMPLAQPRGETWTTKDGVAIPVRDLSNAHLINILRLMRRVELADGLAHCHFAGGMSEASQAAGLDFVVEGLGDRTPADVFPMWEPLDGERKRRGLPEVTL